MFSWPGLSKCSAKSTSTSSSELELMLSPVCISGLPKKCFCRHCKWPTAARLRCNELSACRHQSLDVLHLSGHCHLSNLHTKASVMMRLCVHTACLQHMECSLLLLLLAASSSSPPSSGSVWFSTCSTVSWMLFVGVPDVGTAVPSDSAKLLQSFSTAADLYFQMLLACMHPLCGM